MKVTTASPKDWADDEEDLLDRDLLDCTFARTHIHTWTRFFLKHLFALYIKNGFWLRKPSESGQQLCVWLREIRLVRD